MKIRHRKRQLYLQFRSTFKLMNLIFNVEASAVENSERDRAIRLKRARAYLKATRVQFAAQVETALRGIVQTNAGDLSGRI